MSTIASIAESLPLAKPVQVWIQLTPKEIRKLDRIVETLKHSNPELRTSRNKVAKTFIVDGLKNIQIG